MGRPGTPMPAAAQPTAAWRTPADEPASTFDRTIEPDPGPNRRKAARSTLDGTVEQDAGSERLGARPDAARAALDRMIAAAAGRLLAGQRRDGHWCAELEGDTILESEYVLLLHYLGRGDDPRVRACCERLRNTRLESGGWAIHSGGPTDVSASVKAYLCLKLAGDDPDSPPMAAARREIVAAGGLRACNSYTKLLLAIFGLWSWREAPAVPPEIILLPRWFYFNLYEMSAWTRAIVTPLSVIWALKPSVQVPVTLDELDSNQPPGSTAASRRDGRGERFWSMAFRGVDALIKLAERIGPAPRWRRRALQEAEAWMRPRLGGDDGLGAIFPAIVNAVIALRALGYEEEHPLVQGQLRALERFEIEGAGEMRLQPCFSPVWDTALSMNALLAEKSCVATEISGAWHCTSGRRLDGQQGDAPGEVRQSLLGSSEVEVARKRVGPAGRTDRPPPGRYAAGDALQNALGWLLEQEVTAAGDWQRKSLQQAPGGWCFEYGNDFYPDCDDTAEVLAVLAAIRGENDELERRRQAATIRGLRWLRGMQNPDGGWAAFDRRCDKEILTRIPFADHNAMIDPSTADITARAVGALLAHGGSPSDGDVRRGVEFLLRTQESDGSWYGRWGANYVYGTWLALTALSQVRGAGEASDRAPGRRQRRRGRPGGFHREVDHERERPDRGDAERQGAEASGRTPGAGRRSRGRLHSGIPRSIRAGRDWLLQVQNADGGWGESLRSYEDPDAKGRGRSTASQTAWAMLGLMAATAQAHAARPDESPQPAADGHGGASRLPAEHRDTDRGDGAVRPALDGAADGATATVRPALDQAVAFLRERQAADGGWHDEDWTGVGFPRVFYLRYHAYPLYFPLEALATYRRRFAEGP